MKTLIYIIVIVVIVGAVYLLVVKKPQPASTSNTPQPVSVDVSTEGPPININVNQPTGQASVSIQNFAFAPTTLNVKVGTRVTWTNEDSAAHTVTSDTGAVLSSESLAKGQSYSFTFSQPGTYTYHCSVHPMMKGTVVVTQ